MEGCHEAANIRPLELNTKYVYIFCGSEMVMTSYSGRESLTAPLEFRPAISH